MVGFGGWDMPLQYPTGVLAEHRACREGGVVFDVSHLGSVLVAGPGAVARLQWTLTNDLGRIGPGRAQYSHLVDPDDGHVVDDVIVWWTADDELMVMPNASNTDHLVAALGDATAPLGDEIVVTNVTGSRSLLAVQGPEARSRLATVAPEAAAVGRFRVGRLDARFGEGFVAGTGYTGEDGVEVHVPVEHATPLWEALLGAGLTPAGLGARDTLRLEAGLPLHGHDLGPGITPLQAGLGWVVRFDKGDFRGRAVLAAERERGVARQLVGLAVVGRQVPRAGYGVRAAGEGDDTSGEALGEVTSGNFAPTLERGIALALLRAGTEVGTAVVVDVRGRAVPATVVETPFVRTGPR